MKYEAIYPQDIADGFETGQIVENAMASYNRKCPHAALGLRLPDDAYAEQMNLTKAT